MKKRSKKCYSKISRNVWNLFETIFKCLFVVWNHFTEIIFNYKIRFWTCLTNKKRKRKSKINFLFIQHILFIDIFSIFQISYKLMFSSKDKSITMFVFCIFLQFFHVYVHTIKQSWHIYKTTLFNNHENVKYDWNC